MKELIINYDLGLEELKRRADLIGDKNKIVFLVIDAAINEQSYEDSPYTKLLKIKETDWNVAKQALIDANVAIVY